MIKLKLIVVLRDYPRLDILYLLKKIVLPVNYKNTYNSLYRNIDYSFDFLIGHDNEGCAVDCNVKWDIKTEFLLFSFKKCKNVSNYYDR